MRARARSRGWATAAALCVALLAARAAAREELVAARMQMKDGKVIDCFVERGDNSGVFWCLREDETQYVHLPFTQIEYVRFAPPAGWEEAVAAYNEGEMDLARRLFADLAAKNARFVTVPGNFAVKARLWILESLKVQRRLGDLAAQIEGFEPALLAEHERYGGYLLLVWADIARGRWDEARERINRMLGSDLDLDQQGELWFLRGLVLAEQGAVEEALVALTRVFTVGYGTDRAMERAALSKAIELMVRQERYEEAKGLLSLYRTNYGEGRLTERLGEIEKKLPGGEPVP